MKVRIMKSLASVSLKTALKYRRNWDKNGPTVKLLQSMMPEGGKKGYRLYIPIDRQEKRHFTIPPAVRVALKKAGFVATDYLAKKCVKIGDTEQKNEFNIGKVIAKDMHAKMAFDNDPQLQNSKENELVVVVSCHPYDIIGMSTGRDWDKQSCMRIDDGIVNRSDPGAYSSHVKSDVAEGTLVAYVVSSSDTNIEKPKCRCLLKPFRNNEGDVLYRRETNIYGNTVPGFTKVLSQFLRNINKNVPSGFYEMVSSLYNDGVEYSFVHDQNAQDSEITIDQVYEDIESDLVFDYVRQEIEKIKDPSNDDGGVLELLNRSEVSEFTLKQTQLDEIAELIRGNTVIEKTFDTELLKRSLSPIVAYVGRAAGFFDKHKNVGTTTPILPTSVLNRFAAVDGKATETLLGLFEKEIAKNTFSDEMEAFLRGVLSGAKEVPKWEMLQRFPKMSSLLYTAASAARFMALDGDLYLQEGSFSVLDEMIDPPEKMRGPELAESLTRIGGKSLLFSFFLDVGNPTNDEIQVELIDELAPFLTKRRMFRALDAAKDQNIIGLMDDIKFLQFKRTVTAPEYIAGAYKNNAASIREYMERNSERVNELKFSTGMAKRLIEFHAPLAMHLDFPAVHLEDVIKRTFEPFVEYKGDALEPQSSIMELVAQITVAAGKMLEKPIDLSSKFEVEALSELALSDRLVRIGRTLSDVVIWATYKNNNVALSKSKEIMVKEAPRSFMALDKKDAAQNVRALFKLALSMEDTKKAIGSVSNMIDVLAQLEEIEDKEDMIRNIMAERYEGGEEDDSLREEVEQEVEKVIDGKISQMIQQREALNYLTNVMSDDEEAADLFKDRSDFKDVRDDIYDMYENAHSSYISVDSDLEDIKEKAGW